MSMHDDAETAAQISATLQRIECGDTDYFDGVAELLKLVKQLRSIPANWKDKLLALAGDMELVAGNEVQVAALAERIENAVDRIQELAD